TMTNQTHEFFFEFPAIQCQQGGRVQYMLCAPMNMLKRIMAFDDAGDVMSRSQREVHLGRAKKINRYLTTGYDQKTDYIVPTLVGNIDGVVRFEEAAGVKGGLGTLFISMDADIRLFDGQTRSRGIIDYISARKDSPDTITLLLTVGLPLETRQQFFSDINNNASKPATAISMAYNHKDPLNALVRQIVSDTPALRGRVDYEHNVVPAKSDLLISFKALHDATRKMFGLRAGDEITDALRNDALRLWKAWSVALHWEWLAENIGPAMYRTRHIGTHGVMINAIGIATAMMLENHDAGAIAEMLNHRTTACIEALQPFAHAEWYGVCVDPETDTIKCDTPAQNRAAEKLLNVFGMSTEHPHAWLRPSFDEDVSDEQVAEMAEKIAKVAEEKKLDLAMLKTALPERLALSETPMKPVFANMRRLRAWMSEQFPLPEQQ
ncbi:DGQHR domain-containing protein, partial [Enterobacter hormaechei]|nr:DGQHR domain-containing protein [Enterobacter hormaechei]